MKLRGVRRQAMVLERKFPWLWPDLRLITSCRGLERYIQDQRHEIAVLHANGAAEDLLGVPSRVYLQRQMWTLLAIIKYKLCYPKFEGDCIGTLDGTRLSLMDQDGLQPEMSLRETIRQRHLCTQILLTWGLLSGDIIPVLNNAEQYYGSVEDQGSGELRDEHAEARRLWRMAFGDAMIREDALL